MRLAGIFFYDLDGLQLHHPGTVLQLIARMHGRVIWRLVADHGRDDFEPAHSQAAQRAGVALAFFPVGFLIDARPVAIVPAQIHPQVNGVSQKPVALVAQIDDGHLARLIADRSHARQTCKACGTSASGFKATSSPNSRGASFGPAPGSEVKRA